MSCIEPDIFCPVADKGPRLLVVANSLPITRSGNCEYDVSKLAGIVPVVEDLKANGDIDDYMFFGAVRSAEESIKSDIHGYEELSCVPINLPSELFESYYYGYCKGCLWPLVHYRLTTVRHESSWYEAYVRVNEMFAQKILEHCRPGDLIWIHDYHLMTLPSILRAKLPRGVPIGFFFHAPFPSSELFRILPNRKEMLEGLLGADMIGFQSFEDMRHFQSTVSRLIGVEETFGGIESPFDGGHFVRVGVFPAGINPNTFIATKTSTTVMDRIAQLRAIFAGKHVLVGHDRVDEIEGVPMKLKAFDYFLQRHPEHRGKVVLFQVFESPEEMESEEQSQLQKTVNELVGRINGQYATLNYMPIEYSCKKQCSEELCALYSVADVALITPTRDGMNLASHEYVACQSNNGVLILSEFTGAARCFSGARLVNPFNKKDIADAIAEALEMNEDAKRKKYRSNFKYILNNTCFSWGKRFLNDLINTVQSLISNTSVPMMDITLLRDTYIGTSKRVFFLDCDGTSPSVATHPNMAVPSSELSKILADLARDPHNYVYVISSRDAASLERRFGHLKVGLVAEHGAFLRDCKSVNWEELHDTDMGWRDAISLMMEDFAERTPGSYIEKNRVNITWHYRNCDPRYGVSQARELLSQLQGIVNKYPIEVTVGKKAIEAKPVSISKGDIH